MTIPRTLLLIAGFLACAVFLSSAGTAARASGGPPPLPPESLYTYQDSIPWLLLAVADSVLKARVGSTFFESYLRR